VPKTLLASPQVSRNWHRSAPCTLRQPQLRARSCIGLKVIPPDVHAALLRSRRDGCHSLEAWRHLLCCSRQEFGSSRAEAAVSPRRCAFADGAAGCPLVERVVQNTRPLLTLASHGRTPHDRGSALTKWSGDRPLHRLPCDQSSWHGNVREEGENEPERTATALALSGRAAGLSMGLSFLSMTLAASTSRQLRPQLVVVVILGRQQLYTESTLPATLPVLARSNSSTRLACLRLWASGSAPICSAPCCLPARSRKTESFDRGLAINDRD
jgi:hypothetical protein